MDAVRELLLHFGSQHRRAEGLPPSRHRTGELLEEVLDSARTAAEMVKHHVAHNAPAQARAPAQRGVDISGAHYALCYEVIDLTRQCGLQAVSNVTGHLLVDAHRPLPDRRVEFRCALDCLFRRFYPANDLDQRDQMRRIERVADHAALGMHFACRLDFAHGQARRA